jgi:MATE family multidrug resistance protein
VISISSLAFMPALGFSMGISSMAGHALGRGSPEQARTAVWSGIHLLLIYTLALDGLFIFWPEYMVDFFLQSSNDVAQYEEIGSIASRLLGLVAAYILLDVFYMLFAAVLKGAGDTRFLLLAIFSASLLCMILPLYVGINYFAMNIYAAWSCILLFIGVLCLLTSWRYRQGHWQKMLVIDRTEPGQQSLEARKN